jgi:2-polyprenyl-3-methyl-5-hydroxy-6-metoxy-1,4-benzoquinol methylase
MVAMASDRAPQNIYDDHRFFAGYSRMERFGSGWDHALEQPSFLALLPDVRGLRVLDLGCGAGQLALYLAQGGAADVVGIDVSERMLGLARAERPHPRVTYRLQAIEDVEFPPERFELVASSLAVHYVRDYEGLIRRSAHWLVSGGTLVFSTEHPVYTARLPNNGWVLDSQGQRTGWAIDHYSDEGVREERWFIDGVQKYHRTISTLLNSLINAGFSIERVMEPTPSEDRLLRRPDDIDERRRPMFLLIRASRG